MPEFSPLPDRANSRPEGNPSYTKDTEPPLDELTRLRRENLELRQQVHNANSSFQAGQASRSAALTLMEDAVQARDKAQRAEAAYAASEERLRLILESVREYAIFSMDLDRKIISWNQGAERILGYDEAEIIGLSGDVIFTPEDRADKAPEAECLECLAHGRAGDERWHMRKDGSRFWGSGVLMAMHDQGGETIGFVKVFRDETAARAAREELEEASRAKDHFLAVLSHELRTPLTPALMTALSLLQRPRLNPQVKRGLQMIQRNIELECQLIDELLDLNRISRGKLEISRKRIDLHEIIRQAAEIIRPDLEAKRHNFSLHLGATDAILSGDATRLQQTVWNLLKNAAKFTPIGGSVSLSSHNDDAGNIVVSVADSGAGIPQGKHSTIFDAFAQASDEVSRQFGGLGLGLAIARATIDAHDGRIWAESDGAGKGACFTFILPLIDSVARACIRDHAEGG